MTGTTNRENPTFADHFASVATSYANFRPTYPDELFEWLASVSCDCNTAWDCATGSGQAAVSLTRYFDRVIATDASEAQIRQAQTHPKVEYRVAPAENSNIPPESVALVTVAQALHWFDVERFWQEVERVLLPRGVVAVWTYGLQQVDHPVVNAQIQNIYSNIVGPYWPPERAHCEDGYARLSFPFEPIQAPTFSMVEMWSAAQLAGYLRSWSATGASIKQNGFDPITDLEDSITSLVGSAAATLRVEWPLAIKVGTLRPNS